MPVVLMEHKFNPSTREADETDLKFEGSLHIEF